MELALAAANPAVEAPTRRELARYAAHGGRVAVIGRHHLGVDAVLPDNTSGGRLVAEHLLSLGHRRLAIASGSTGLSTVADRLRGIHEALEAGGIRGEVPLVEAPFTRDGGRESVRRILAEHPDTTAILALNDDMAIGCLSELRAAGVRVPTRSRSPGSTTSPWPATSPRAHHGAAAHERDGAALPVPGAQGAGHPAAAPDHGRRAGRARLDRARRLMGPRPLRIVVASDKFKGSLPAADVAAALSRGIHRACRPRRWWRSRWPTAVTAPWPQPWRPASPSCPPRSPGRPGSRCDRRTPGGAGRRSSSSPTLRGSTG